MRSSTLTSALCRTSATAGRYTINRCVKSHGLQPTARHPDDSRGDSAAVSPQPHLHVRHPAHPPPLTVPVRSLRLRTHRTPSQLHPVHPAVHRRSQSFARSHGAAVGLCCGRCRCCRRRRCDPSVLHEPCECASAANGRVAATGSGATCGLHVPFSVALVASHGVVVAGAHINSSHRSVAGVMVSFCAAHALAVWGSRGAAAGWWQSWATAFSSPPARPGSLHRDQCRCAIKHPNCLHDSGVAASGACVRCCTSPAAGGVPVSHVVATPRPFVAVSSLRSVLSSFLAWNTAV